MIFPEISLKVRSRIQEHSRNSFFFPVYFGLYRVFPFHPICRGFNAGKRSVTPPEPASLKGYALPKDTSSSTSSSSKSSKNHNEQVARTGIRPPRPLGLVPDCLSPNAYDILYRKYAFAPKCRGTTSKRSVPNVIPTLESPWMEQNLPDTLGLVVESIQAFLF